MGTFYNDSDNYYLAHYGVLGMKWGRRKAPQYTKEDLAYLNRSKKSMKRRTAVGAIAGGVMGGIAGATYGSGNKIKNTIRGIGLGTGAGAAGGASSGGINHLTNIYATRSAYDPGTGRRTPLLNEQRAARERAIGVGEGATYAGLPGAVAGYVIADRKYKERSNRRSSSGGRTTVY